jgi:hypothetical protein
VLLGSAAAAGLPFAALVGDVSAAFEVTDCTAQVVAAAVEGLLAAPVHDGLLRCAREIVAAADAAARDNDLHMGWRGPAAMPQLSFADQEGAPADLILHHFGLELAAAGVAMSGPLLLPTDLLREGTAAAALAFRSALARVRTLLIEFNSFLSGGLPFTWPGGHGELRARGAMIYRYPKRAEVDVGPAGAAMRIAFAAAPLGAVTSSGFYLPTRLTGDVDASVRYVLHRFESGPDTACLGLFLQNEASSARYYAQVMSSADAPVARSAALGHAGAAIGRVRVDGDEGRLRLVRRAGRVHAFHGAGATGPWRELGSVPAVADDLVVGAKIWSGGRTDGLVADLHDLAVDARLAADQPPLLGPRPDPRGR